MPEIKLSVANTLPADAGKALLAGRVWRPDVAGPSVVIIRDDNAIDITAAFPTMRDLCETADPAGSLRGAKGETIGSVADILANTPPDRRDRNKPWLLAPLDLQAVKAAGVTFITSLLERVIEERARGDFNAAAAIRVEVERLVGKDLRALKPGSQQAMDLKRVLIEQGAWSQYLEVGIGPDAEIFTKTTPMASVGTGMDAGLHPKSTWNNPEPEVVMVVSSKGRIVGAALGNDVNLRDFEGRSALLLSKAKDNNASCAIGPFIRFFDGSYTLDNVRRATVTLTVEGEDNFRLEGVVIDRRDRARPGGSGFANDGKAPSISGRRRAVSRHHVRADPGSRYARQGLHPQIRRHRHHRRALARQTRQSHALVGRLRAMDFRLRRIDAQSGQTRPAFTHIEK